jgi:L-seryl-tRNA(Ser) seleniumtransferase
MLREGTSAVKRRAERIAAALDGGRATVAVRRSEVAIGGGSVPGASIPSWSVELQVEDATALAARLRTGNPSVFCRIDGATVGLDARTVADEEVDDLVRAIRYAFEGTGTPTTPDDA